MEAYDGPQIVGMDLHRRRSVLVRMSEDGQKLATARITNSPARLLVSPEASPDARVKLCPLRLKEPSDKPGDNDGSRGQTPSDGHVTVTSVKSARRDLPGRRNVTAGSIANRSK